MTRKSDEVLTCWMKVCDILLQLTFVVHLLSVAQVASGRVVLPSVGCVPNPFVDCYMEQLESQAV